MQFDAPLLVAEPLPPRMHPLGVQDVIRGQQEPRCQELEETLILATIVPQESSRLILREGHEGLPQVFGAGKVVLEGSPVRRPGCVQALDQGEVPVGRCQPLGGDRRKSQNVQPKA